MMALIDTSADESPLVREIAGWVVSGKIDDAIDADTDAAYMDALRRRWPEATDEEITRGFQSQRSCSRSGETKLRVKSLARRTLTDIAATGPCETLRRRSPGRRPFRYQ